jgi:hypothetical protein
MSFRVRTGKVVGRDHLLDGRNCQDALYQLAFEINGSPYVVGVVSDGCGEGQHSEIGAKLAAPFLCYAARHALIRQAESGKLSTGALTDDLPATLFEQLRRFLQLMLDSYAFDEQEGLRFIHDHLLFTVIGFVITPGLTQVFAWGDGLILLNDTLYCCEREQAPAYPGYQLVAGQEAGSYVSHQLPTPELRHLAIGSDAWIEEQELLKHIWERPAPIGLQLLMNTWSDARHFRDDASMITVEQIGR